MREAQFSSLNSSGLFEEKREKFASIPVKSIWKQYRSSSLHLLPSQGDDKKHTLLSTNIPEYKSIVKKYKPILWSFLGCQYLSVFYAIK